MRTAHLDFSVMPGRSSRAAARGCAIAGCLTRLDHNRPSRTRTRRAVRLERDERGLRLRVNDRRRRDRELAPTGGAAPRRQLPARDAVAAGHFADALPGPQTLAHHSRLLFVAPAPARPILPRDVRPLDTRALPSGGGTSSRKRVIQRDYVNDRKVGSPHRSSPTRRTRRPGCVATRR